MEQNQTKSIFISYEIKALLKTFLARTEIGEILEYLQSSLPTFTAGFASH